MRTLSMFIWIILYNIIQHVSSNKKPVCRSFKSDISSQDKDATTKPLICSEKNSNFPTLVSCGFQTKDSTEGQFGGSYILGDQCIARNAENGAGVFAWARCCKFENDQVSCAAINGTAKSGDDQVSYVFCHNSETMLGCTGITKSSYMDGSYVGQEHPNTVVHTGPTYSYPMNNYCNAQDGGGGNTKANINCCTANIGLECNIYYDDAGANNIFECPTDQTLMSCNAMNNYRDAIAWYIQNSPSGGQCITKSRDSTIIYTSAICCNEVTSSPTRFPTKDPSTTPTISTGAPTTPTNNPTYQPTRTRNPTADPTRPTNAPTSAPSFAPSNPSAAPSDAPSLSPSPAPTRKTRDPTVAPTIPPSTAPTSVTETPTAPIATTEDPNANPGGKNEEGNVLGNNETLYLILFIIFGVLFCCLLLGLTYYCFRNKKQSNEVNYNNAHVAVASSPSPLNKFVDASDGIVAGHLEGVNATTNDTTPGTNVVDASVGIKTTGGNNLTRGNNNTWNTGNTGTTGTTGTSTGQSYNAGIDGMSDKEYDNYLKDVNEDDQKQDVFKVSM